jgi:hypothetical protein
VCTKKEFAKTILDGSKGRVLRGQSRGSIFPEERFKIFTCFAKALKAIGAEFAGVPWVAIAPYRRNRIKVSQTIPALINILFRHAMNSLQQPGSLRH